MNSAAGGSCVHTLEQTCVFICVCSLYWARIEKLVFSYPGLPGGNIILACRDMEKCEAAAKEIRGETLNHRVSAWHLDLASLKSIREFAAKIIEGRREDAGLVGRGRSWADTSPRVWCW